MEYSAENILAKVKGLSPFPGAWFMHKNNRLKIVKAEKISKNGKSGEVLSEDLIIACEHKAIKILSFKNKVKKF